MLRLIIFIIIAGLLSTAGIYLADYEGDVTVQVGHHELSTSLVFFIILLILLLAGATLFIELLLWIKNIPKRRALKRDQYNQHKGMALLVDGFTAIAAGESKKALKLVKKTESCLGETPLTKILAVQATQLEGDAVATKKQYTAMLENKDTEIIALKGLLKQAMKENNFDFAIYLSNKALGVNPDLLWAKKVLFELHVKLGQYKQAQDVIESTKERLSTDYNNHHLIGILLLARSLMAYQAKDYQTSYDLIMHSYKFLKHFPPVVAHMARIYYEVKKNIVKALRIVESGWKQQPHPDLARAYLLILEDIPYDKRIKKCEKLLQINSEDEESHIIMARVAMDTGSYSIARNHLKTILARKETKSICAMMIELEQLDNENANLQEEAIKKWKKRLEVAPDDNQWSCHKCGHTSNVWSVCCSNCQSFASFDWQSDGMRIIQTNSPDETLNF